MFVSNMYEIFYLVYIYSELLILSVIFITIMLRSTHSRNHMTKEVIHEPIIHSRSIRERLAYTIYLQCAIQLCLAVPPAVIQATIKTYTM